MSRNRILAILGFALVGVLVIGGTATAAGLITSKQIKDGAIRMIDLRKGVQKKIKKKALPGPQGPVGPAGAKGDTGATGPAGAKGDTGAAGPAGPAGAKGDTGAAGPAGPAGAKGDTGVAGPAGPAGPTGPAGAKGDIGAQGPAGPKGDTGAKGADGVSGYIALNETIVAAGAGNWPGVGAVQANGDFEWTQNCPTGLVVYGGGVRFDSGVGKGEMVLAESGPSWTDAATPNGWTVSGHGNPAAAYTVWAICGEAA